MYDNNSYIGAQSVKAKWRNQFLSLPGVWGVGTTIVNGVPTIIVMSDSIQLTYPASVEGVPVRSVVRPKPEFQLMVTPTQSQFVVGTRGRNFNMRPMPAGLYVAPHSESGKKSQGTAGLTLFKDNNAYIVSNLHVIGLEHTIPLNVFRLLDIGTPVYQPDVNCVSKELGYPPLVDTHIANLDGLVPLNIGEPYYIDLAWAKARSTSLISDRIYEMELQSSSRILLENNIREPILGEIVYKSGGTSGFTRGRVTITDLDLRYSTWDYDFKEPIFYDCLDQIDIESIDGIPFSESGDSGSIIVGSDGSIIGIVSRGNDYGTIAGKAKYIVQYMGTGFYYRKPLPILKDEGPVPGLPTCIPRIIIPGSVIAPGPVIDTLIPKLEWDHVPEAKRYVIGIVKGIAPDDISVHDAYVDSQNYYNVPLGVLEYGQEYSWGLMPVGTAGMIRLDNPEEPQLLRRSFITFPDLSNVIKLLNIPVEIREPVQGYLGEALRSELVLVDPLEHKRGAIIGFVGKHSPGEVSYIPPLKFGNLKNRLAIHDFIVDEFGLIMTGHWNESQSLRIVILTGRQFFQQISNPIGAWDLFVVALSLDPYPEGLDEIVSMIDLVNGTIAAKIFKNAFEVRWPHWYDGDPTMGDLNNDGVRDWDDWNILRQYFFGRPIAELSPLSEAEFLRRADINKDGRVDSGDMIALRWLVYFAGNVRWPHWYDGDPTMGDLNNDGVRDFKDYDILRQYYVWGSPISSISPLSEAEFLHRADINKDGKIDVGDLTSLSWLIYWG